MSKFLRPVLAACQVDIGVLRIFGHLSAQPYWEGRRKLRMCRLKLAFRQPKPAMAAFEFIEFPRADIPSSFSHNTITAHFHKLPGIFDRYFVFEFQPLAQPFAFDRQVCRRFATAGGNSDPDRGLGAQITLFDLLAGWKAAGQAFLIDQKFVLNLVGHGLLSAPWLSGLRRLRGRCCRGGCGRGWRRGRR